MKLMPNDTEPKILFFYLSLAANVERAEKNPGMLPEVSEQWRRGVDALPRMHEDAPDLWRLLQQGKDTPEVRERMRAVSRRQPSERTDAEQAFFLWVTIALMVPVTVH